MNNTKEINLTDFEKENLMEGEKMKVFVDEGGNVETFLTYKGMLIDCVQLEKKRKMLGADKVDYDLRHSIILGLQKGDIIGLSFGEAHDFDLLAFLSFFKWFNVDSFFFKKNYMDKKYLLSNKILLEDEDIDVFQTKGYYSANPKSRIVICISTDASKLESIKKTLNDKYFEFVIVK